MLFGKFVGLLNEKSGLLNSHQPRKVYRKVGRTQYDFGQNGWKKVTLHKDGI